MSGQALISPELHYQSAEVFMVCQLKLNATQGSLAWLQFSAPDMAPFIRLAKVAQIPLLGAFRV